MNRLAWYTILFFVVSIGNLLAQVTPPKIDYIIPDIGAPGMNTYVEIIAPFNYFGKFGTADGLISTQGISVALVNPADSNRVVVSPCIVSWDGRLISCQFFVHPKASLGPVPFRIQSGTVQSNVDTFFIVAPQTFGTKSGGGVIGSGSTWGTRSKRGAMIVDSLVLNSGTYTISTNDPDPYAAGNQGYLPFILLSKGRIVINSGATITGNASGKNGGPGGGGSGGFGSGSTVPGEIDLPLGSGFTGGKHATLPLFSPTGGDGTGTGTGPTSLNELAPNTGFTANGTTVRLYGSGPGHPFDNDGRSGGAAIYTGNGLPNIFGSAYGGGGNATAGSGTSNATADGQIIGNVQVVPLHGGAGGSSGGFNDYSGGGGGGAIALYSASISLVSSAQAKGANGQNGCNGCGSGIFSGDPSAGGAGGGILIGAKRGVSIGSLDVSGGTGGSATGTATSVAGTGGVGRFRHDGRLTGAPTLTTNATRFVGPTLDTLTYVDSIQWTVRGTGRYANGRGDSIMILVRGHNTPFNIGNGITTAVLSDSTWSARITFPYDSIAYILAIQRCDTNVGTTQYTRVPTYIMSQAAASVVRLNLFPDLDAPTSVDFGKMVCPAYRFDTIRVYNRGTGPLFLGSSTGFQGPNALYYRLTSPVIPDTIHPGTYRDLIIRFDGITAPTGNRSTTLRLISNDPTSPHDIAISAVRESRNYTVTPRDINLGTVMVGAFKDTVAVYTNNNTFTDSITAVVQRSGYREFSWKNIPTLTSKQPSGASTQLGFRFAPKDTGQFIAQFTVRSGPCNDSVVVTLRGYAKSPIAKAPKYMELFGLACADTAYADIAVKNIGNAPLVVKDDYWIGGTDAANFVVQTIIPDSTLPPITVGIGDSMIFRIRVISTLAKPLSARLYFRTNDVTSGTDTMIVDLFADPDPAVLKLSDSTIDFGTVCLGKEEQRELTFSNMSSRTLVRIDSIRWGKFGTPFSHTTFNTPLPISAQGNAPVGITFRPPGTGMFRDTFYVSTYPCGKVQRILVSGIGASAATKTDVTSLDFGDVRVGTTARKTMWIYNRQPIGSPDLMLDSILLVPPVPTVSIISPIMPPRRVFRPGDSIQVVLEFKPTTGGKLPTMFVHMQVGDNCRDTIRRPVAGNGITASVAASRNELSLAPPFCGVPGPVNDTLTIFNFGQAPLNVTDITSNNGEFTATPTSFTLTPQGAKIITVRYTPGTSRTSTAVLTVKTSDPERPSFMIDLSGRWDSVGHTVSTRAINFGQVQRCSLPATQKLRFTNNGTVADTIVIPTLSNPAYQVLQSGTSIPVPQIYLQPGESTEVDVEFYPSTNTPSPADLIVLRTPCNVPDTIHLTGGVTSATYSSVEASFGDVRIGSSGTASATVINGSNFPVRISSASFTPAWVDLAVPPGQFPITIQPGGSGAIALTYSPTLVGPIPSTIQLKVTVDSLCPDSIMVGVAGQGIEGALALNKRTMDYRNVLTCVSSQDTLRIRNVGDIPITLGTAVISPTPEYTVVSNSHNGGTLQPGDTATIVIRFAPGTGTDGPVPGSLNISTTDQDIKNLLVSLNGTRVSEAATFIPPTFVPSPVGLPDRRTATFINTGTSPLLLTSATGNGPFTVISTQPPLPVTLAPGDTLFVDIEFTPDIAGEQTGSVSIASAAKCIVLPDYPLDGFGEGTVAATGSWSSASGRPGDVVRFSLNLDDDVTKAVVQSVHFGLIFNPTLLKPLGVVLDGTLTDGWTVSQQTSNPGSVVVTLTGTSPLAGPGILAHLDMLVMLGDSTASWIIPSDSVRFDSRRATLDLTPGIFTLEGYCVAGGNRLVRIDGNFGLKQAYPNPTSGITDIEFELVEDGPTELVLIDPLGRVATVLVDDNLSAGSHVATLRAAEHPTGLYMLELRTPTQRDVRRLIIAQ